MAAKTVAVDSEAYALLRRAKRPGETFSDVVKRTMRPRKPLAHFAGAWKDTSEKDWVSVKRLIVEGRRLDRGRQKRLEALSK